MDDSTRHQYLARLDREGTTLGATIPETVTVRGEPLPLRKVVFETCADGSVPTGYGIGFDEVKTMLRREQTALENELETEDISTDRAEAIVEKTHSLTRALEMLSAPDDNTSLEQEMKTAEVADTKRWRAFVQEVKDPLD